MHVVCFNVLNYVLCWCDQLIGGGRSNCITCIMLFGPAEDNGGYFPLDSRLFRASGEKVHVVCSTVS